MKKHQDWENAIPAKPYRGPLRPGTPAPERRTQSDSGESESSSATASTDNSRRSRSRSRSATPSEFDGIERIHLSPDIEEPDGSRSRSRSSQSRHHNQHGGAIVEEVGDTSRGTSGGTDRRPIINPRPKAQIRTQARHAYRPPFGTHPLRPMQRPEMMRRLQMRAMQAMQAPYMRRSLPQMMFIPHEHPKAAQEAKTEDVTLGEQCAACVIS